jgi:hypothetical protein
MDKDCDSEETNMRTEWRFRLMGIAFLGVAMAMLAPAAFSQSCSLCYTQAASSGHRMIEALRSGILVLIIPPTLMWLVIAAVLYARRNRFKQADDAARPFSDW